MSSADGNATAPALRGVQAGAGAPDDLARGINLFRGQLEMPVDLVSLPGRNGLDVGLTATYSSAVRRRVELRNRDAPTSVLGVGWSLGHERIVAGDRLVGLSGQQRFFLVDPSGVQPLYRTGESDRGIHFQLREYQFWTIELRGAEEPGSSRWIVVGEDGSTRTYGGPGATEWGAAWDGWVGPSTAGGAASFPVGWALAEICSPEQDRVAYAYDADEVEIGGAPVTRALRLAAIDDPLGRRVELRYREKEPFENEMPERPPEGMPPAYQFPFDTHYLDAITVRERSGDVNFRQRLGYELMDAASPAEPRPAYTKRYLTEVRQEPPDGRVLPALRLEYETDPAAPALGALRRQWPPTGARVRYGYEPARVEHSAGALEVDGPAEHRPGVTHGADFTVLTWYAEGSGRLEVWVCAWSGVWRVWRDDSLADREVRDLSVHPGDGFFALRYRDVTAELPGVRLYHQDPYRLGSWEATELEIDPDLAELRMATGADFVALQGAGAGWMRIVGWDALRKRWDEQGVSTPAAGHVALGGGDGFVLGAFGAEDSEQVRLQVFHRDEEGAWGPGGYADLQLQVDWSLTSPDSVWAASSAFAAATFVTGVEGGTVAAAVALLRWRPGYAIADAEVRGVTQPTDARNPILYSRIAEALVGHAGDVLRLDAGRWEQLRLVDPLGESEYRYGYGSDLALAAELRDGVQSFEARRYDPYAGRWVREGAPSAPELRGEAGLLTPAVAGDYAQLGRSVFTRDPEGEWRSVHELPESAIGPSCALRGSGYLAYQRDGDPATEVVFLENGGVAGAVLRLPGERCYVPDPGPEEVLAGPRTLVTYRGEEFATARTLTLHRAIDAAMPAAPTLPVVVEAEIDGGFGERTMRIDYDERGAAFDATASTVQFTRTRVRWSSDPGAGSTLHTFYNGLEPDDEGAFYPPDGRWSNVRGFISLVNGQIWKSEAFDAEGRLASRMATSFWVYDRAEGPPGAVPADTLAVADAPNLAGAYMRIRRWERTLVCPATDAPEERVEVTRAETFAHNARGQVAATTAYSVAPDGSEERYTTATTYAWEVYDALRERNLLTPVAQVTRRNETSGRVTGIDVTTYVNRWPSAGERELWAPRDSYSWRGEEGTGTFDFARWSDLEAPPDGWLRTERVLDRSPAGYALERLDVDGVTSSTVFDRDDLFPVASLNATSRSAGEGWYWGFEDYEQPGPWRVSAPGARERGTAFAGSWCLRVPGSARGEPALAGTFHATAGTDSLMIACRACTPRGAVAGAGEAVWRCEAGGVTRELPLGDADESARWMLSHVPLHPADFGLDRFDAIRIELVNRRPGVDLLLDALFVNPLRGEATATVYRQPHGLASACVARLGPASSTWFDDLRRPIVELGDGGVPSRLLVDHVWTETAPERDPRAPSFTLTATVRVRGDSLDPAQGDGYLERWSQSGCWTRDGDALEHTGAEEGLLSTRWSRRERAFAVRARFEPLDPDPRPFGLLLGGARLAYREASWELLGPCGEVLASAPAPGPPRGDLLALGNDGGIEVMVNGRPLIAAAVGPQPQGALGAFASGRVRVAQLLAAEGVSAGVTYRDDTMRPLQEQTSVADGVLARAHVLDRSARPAVLTRPVPVPRGLLGFRPDLVSSFDWTSGVLAGAVADAYPEDEGYPYGRSRYEAAPLGGVVETGLPGRELAIDERVPEPERHTHRTLHQAARPTSGALSLPSGAFLVSGWADQDGQRLRRASDPLGRPTREVRDNALDPSVPAEVRSWEYDDAGRLRVLRLPNAFDPSRADADAFCQRFAYDFLGRLVRREQPNVDAPSESVYDAGGRVRFALDARGAAEGTFACIRYDALGRMLEDGICRGAWDRELLEAHAERRDWMPPGFEPLGLREYDGDGTDPHSVGRLVRTVARPPGGSGPTVTERFRYDVEGRLVGRDQEIDPDGGADRVAIAYDLRGNVVRQEHTGPDGEPFSIEVGHDDAERPVALRAGAAGRAAETLARYAYTAEDQVEAETLGPETAAPLERRYRYGPAGRLTAIEDGAFVLRLAYDGSHAGRITGTSERFPNPPPLEGFLAAFSTTVARDGQQRLRSVSNSAGEEYGLGTVAPLTYDANGNLLGLSRGRAIQAHRYGRGTDRLVEVVGVGSYAYDAEGGLSRAEPLGIERVDRHPASGLPLRLQIAGGSPVTYAYTASGARVLERNGTATAVLVHDGEGRPIARRVRAAGGWRTVRHLYGPKGLAAAVSGDRRLFAIRDHLGSLRGLHDGERLLAAASYQPLGDPLGARWIDPGLAPLLPQGFTGQPQGPPPGLVIFPARLYDPFTGRFDRLDPSGRHSSPFAYAAGNPIDYLDPDGADPLGAALGFVVGALLTVAGIVAIVVSGGAATPGVAAAWSIGGSFLLGAGLASAAYGAQQVPAGARFDAGEWMGMTALGGVFGAISGGASVLAQGAVSATRAFLFEFGVGIVSGAADGIIGNGVVNSSHGRDFDEGWLPALLVGAGFGAAGGAGAGFTGRRVALQNVRRLSAMAKRDSVVWMHQIHSSRWPSHSVVRLGEGVAEVFDQVIDGAPDPSNWDLLRGGRNASLSHWPARGRTAFKTNRGSSSFVTVSQDSWGSAQKYAENAAAARIPRTYSFFSNSCTNQALDVVRQTGLTPPPWAYTPTTAVYWIRSLSL